MAILMTKASFPKRFVMREMADSTIAMPPDVEFDTPAKNVLPTHMFECSYRYFKKGQIYH